jgi:hypothetical protein
MQGITMLSDMESLCNGTRVALVDDSYGAETRRKRRSKVAESDRSLAVGKANTVVDGIKRSQRDVVENPLSQYICSPWEVSPR